MDRFYINLIVNIIHDYEYYPLEVSRCWSHIVRRQFQQSTLGHRHNLTSIKLFFALFRKLCSWCCLFIIPCDLKMYHLSCLKYSYRLIIMQENKTGLLDREIIHWCQWWDRLKIRTLITIIANDDEYNVISKSVWPLNIHDCGITNFSTYMFKYSLSYTRYYRLSPKGILLYLNYPCIYGPLSVRIGTPV